jgi:aminoglycoside phosphotransferase
VPELSTLEHDFDKINEATLSMLCEKLPEASEIFNYILSRYEKLRELIAMPVFTLTYNDFYWSNLIVRKDKREALMFDYNMLGKGYRYSDFRNVCWSMSKEAGMIFVDRYNKLYTDKYGTNRIAGEVIEKQIDDVMDYLYGLIMDFERGKFPKWKDNGIMLENLKKLLQ